MNTKIINPDHVYTDKEINQVAEWFETLTFPQLVFLKACYEDMLQKQARMAGTDYVQ